MAVSSRKQNIQHPHGPVTQAGGGIGGRDQRQVVIRTEGGKLRGGRNCKGRNEMKSVKDNEGVDCLQGQGCERTREI